MIKFSDIETFRDTCQKAGWGIISVNLNRIVYIDGECIPHFLEIGPETKYRIMDCD